MSFKAGCLSKQTSTFEIIEIKNLTGNTPLSPTGTQIEVTSCQQNELTFFVENAKCALDHLISLSAKIHLNSNTFDFQATGKIIELKSVEGPTFKISIRMLQFDKKLRSLYLASLLKTQDRADKLLSAIKGEDS